MTQAYVEGVDEGRIIETAEMNLVVIFGAKLSIDGDQYCWLAGDNQQEGVAGFGRSPYLAALDFNKRFYAELPPVAALSAQDTDGVAKP